jgi:CBS domain-containing protein
MMADVRVKDVMTHPVVALDPSDTIHNAAQKLARNRISGAPVVEDGKVVGVVSESDLIHAVLPPIPVDRGASIIDILSVIGRAKPRAHEHGKTVAEVMSPLVIQVAPSASVWRAASIMEDRGINRLPVVDDEDHLLGIVSRADLVKAMARDDEQIRADVIDAIEVLGTETVRGLEVEGADGVMTLRGTADRKSTRDLAIKLASRTPGVVEVVSRLDYETDDAKVRFPRETDPKDPRLDWHAGSEAGGVAR